MKDKNTKPDAKTSTARRNAAKLLVGGGILGASTIVPKQWVKPVIDSAILPAHADTTIAYD